MKRLLGLAWWRLNKIPNWWLLAIPPAIWMLGWFCNALVIGVNGGQMPVLYPGGCETDVMVRDSFHRCMTHGDHLKFLADWIYIGSGMMSIGDGFAKLYDYLNAAFYGAWFAFVLIELEELRR